MKSVYPIAVSCHVLQVSNSSYFRWRQCRHSSTSRCSDELALAHIRAIHAEFKGAYGWPRMQKELHGRGLRIGKERVRKLMAMHGIRAKTKRKFIVTTDSKHSLPVAPDLVQRRFTPQAPNQLLCGDITYIATDEGWLSELAMASIRLSPLPRFDMPNE